MTIVPAVTAPPDVWGSWVGDPLVASGLILAVWCHARGVAAIWRRAGAGRVVRRWQVWAWACAMLALFVALVSPLDAAAETLFSAHMAQHTLLTLVAGPLLAASAPVLPLLQGLPHRARQRVARWYGRAHDARRLTSHRVWPFAVVGQYLAVMWLWHLPVAYEAALRSPAVHAVEHLTLIGASVLLWWTVMVTGRRSLFGYGTGIAVVFLAGIAHGGLGAVLTFAPHVLYARYGATAQAWGVDALHDQHLAGVIMWAPGKVVHGVAVVALALAWLSSVEARAQGRAPTISPGTEARRAPG
ncbi:MAG TPA: cytochrome c oxidase assembly protein [Euzebyales bacterium]|nr:cytochrome c oxidase assembly protein [Euzebyales bacterium]